MDDLSPDEGGIPLLALSIRQPWAYGVAVGLKPIENRDWRTPNPGLNFRGAFAIHASIGMTQDGYWYGAEHFLRCGVICPPPHELVRGAIIGTAEVVDIVKASDSPWFFGRLGLVIANARLLEKPVPCSGSLGFFEWRPRVGDALVEPAKWMRPIPPKASEHTQRFTLDLFAARDE